MSSLFRESLIGRLLLRLWSWLTALWEQSYCRRGWHAIGRAFDGSLLCRFFRSDWDAALGVPRSHILQGGLGLIRGIGRRARGAGTVPRLLRESLICRLLSERLAFALLCLVGFTLPLLPTALLLLLTLCALAVYLLNVLLGRISVSLPSLTSVVIALFAFSYLLCTADSFAFPASVTTAVLFLGLMCVLPAVTGLLSSRRRMNIFLTGMVLSAVLVSLYGLYQYFTGVAIDEAWVDTESFSFMTTRAFATFGNPNVFGEYLIVLTSLTVGMLWKCRSFWGKCLYGVSALLMAAALLATGSRGAMLGLALSAGLFALLAERRLIPLGLLGLAALPFVMPENMIARFQGVLSMTDSSSLYRLSIYAASFDMIKSYWLTGIGVAAFNVIYPYFAYSAANAYHAHNLYLEVFLEQGVAGIALLVLLLLFYFQRMYRSIHLCTDGWRYLTGTLFGALAGLLAHGMADHLWFNYRIVLLFWLTIGLGLAAAKNAVEVKD